MEFNSVNAALAALQSAIASAQSVVSALESELDSVQSTLSEKAAQSDLTALSTQHSSDVSTINAALALRGNCQIETGSYTGNGEYNSGSKCSLTFSKVPLLVFVAGGNGQYTMLKGSSYAYGSGSVMVNLTWSGKTVSWYGNSAANQLNVSGTTYYYAALLPLGA